MDRRDRLAPGPEGGRCAACGGRVPGDNLRILARRDDLAFVEIDCPICHSTGLAMVIGPTVALDGPMDPDAPAIGVEDVAAMRRFLAGYRGDLRGLFTSDRRDAGHDTAAGDAHGSAA